MSVDDPLYGHYPPLTNEEKSKAADWLTHVKELDCPPSYREWLTERPLLFAAKFLYARRWNVADAAEMYRKSALWRLHHRLETTPLFPAARAVRGYDESELVRFQGLGTRPTNTPLDETARAVEDLSFSAYHFWDKGGRPVFLERLGLSDPRCMVERYAMLARPEESISKKFCDLDRYNNEIGGILVRYNNARRREVNSGEVISELTIVLDAAGIGLHHFGRGPLSLLRDSMDIAQAYYPDGIHKILVANTPPVMAFGWNLVKPFLSSRTQSKIVFLKQGDETRRELGAAIDADKLPQWLGGNCSCPGGCVPSFGGSQQSHWAMMDKTFLTHSTTVDARASKVVEVPVGAANAPLRWSLALDSLDIDYAISATSHDGRQTLALGEKDKARYGSGRIEALPASLGCSVATPCRVLIALNNEYSWATAKSVRYRVEPHAAYDADVAWEASITDSRYHDP